MNDSVVEALQRELDRNPDDHDLRLVLADRLDELGDERANGYRASVYCKRYIPCSHQFPTGWFNVSNSTDTTAAYFLQRWTDTIPGDWYAHLRKGRTVSVNWQEYKNFSSGYDDLAQAFTRLPPERQQQLLQGELT